jgi:hypothetical protein
MRNRELLHFLKEDHSALATIEWILLLGAVIVPITFFIFRVSEAVAHYYSMTSWTVSLPFP